jgi:hypothetical protein
MSYPMGFLFRMVTRTPLSLICHRLNMPLCTCTLRSVKAAVLAF